MLNKNELILGQSIPLEIEFQFPLARNATEVWLEMIESSRECIDIQVFYIRGREGSTLNYVLGTLIKKAKQGTPVRILLDKKFHIQKLSEGDKLHAKTIDEFSNTNGVQLKFIDLNDVGISGGVVHSKLIIVDRERLWLGSQNLDWKSLEHIFELGVACTSPSVAALAQSIFDLDWAGKAGDLPASGRVEWNSCRFLGVEHHVAVTASPARRLPVGVADHFETIRDLVRAAKRSVSIQTSKYSNTLRGVPEVIWPKFETELIAAAARGVEVRLMVDDSVKGYNGRFQSLLSLNRHQNIEVKLVNVPEYSSGFIEYARMSHAKCVVSDSNMAWIGTSNLTPDDFINSRNIGLIVKGERFSEEITAYFDKLWTLSFTAHVT